MEDRAQTWRLLGVTAVGFVAASALTAWLPWALKPLGSALIALFSVRLFIFLHDAEHGAIFRGSLAGRVAMYLIAWYTLNAPAVWRTIHDLHHRTNAKPLDLPLSQYRRGDLLNRTVTLEQWRVMSPKERRSCKTVSHPLVFILGFVAAFMFSHGVAPVVRGEWRGVAAICAWSSLLAIYVVVMGWTHAVTLLLLPNVLGAMLGVYLFYAQHHFPTVKLASPSDWSLSHAALHGSSFFEMPGWMHWFTGNIAYHHVHHVNHRIPFYRLPEAMAALPELANPGRTSFRPADVLGCLRSNVWDETAQRMISFAEADARIAETRLSSG